MAPTPLKDPCTMHHALALAMPEAGITQASHTSVRGKWAIKGLIGASLVAASLSCSP